MTTITADAGSRLRSAAAPALFLLLGVVYATWAARIPAIRDALSMNASQLGFVLLCAGIGSVISFPVAAALVGRLGGKRGALLSGLALLLILPLLALAPSLWLLMAAMVLYGMAGSVFDVAINAIGAAAEKAAGRSIMSMLHAWFCVGTFSGAMFSSLLASYDVTPLPHFILISLLLAAVLWISCGALPEDRSAQAPEKKRFTLPHGHLVVLGVIGFCGAIAEGSLIDWSTVYMHDQMRASEGIAPLGFAAFSLLMLAARLVCDRLKDRFGARSVVAIGALLAAAGIFISIYAPNIAVAIVGFGIAGAGLAAVFPFVYGAAAKHGSTALAGVATLGYSGALLGPPAVGFTAQHFGMQAALGFIGLLSIGVALAASRAKWLE
jgi:MFS family permease